MHFFSLHPFFHTLSRPQSSNAFVNAVLFLTLLLSGFWNLFSPSASRAWDMEGSVVADSQEAFFQKSPFYFPQFTIFSGRSSLRTTFKSPDGERLDVSMGNSNWFTSLYGLEAEINHTRFSNIGFSFVIDTHSKEWDYEDANGRGHFESVANHFLLGSFYRVFYPFLNQRVNLFARLGIGIGPYTGYYIPNLDGSGSIPRLGFGVRGTVLLGIEAYVSRWLGITAGYGPYMTRGGLSDLQSNKNLKGVTIEDRGHFFMIGLKTTYL